MYFVDQISSSAACDQFLKQVSNYCFCTSNICGNLRNGNGKFGRDWKYPGLRLLKDRRGPSQRSEHDYHARRECVFDPGGYFIINGKERATVAQEKLPENRPVVYQVLRHHKFELECEILCSVKNSSRPVSALWVRRMQENKVDLKKALGCTCPEEVITFVIQGDTDEVIRSKINFLIDYSLDLWEHQLSRTDALDKIGSPVNGASLESTLQERIDLAREVLDDFVLQNIDATPESDWEKIRFICYILRKDFGSNCHSM
ncbi:unnamed protein product [Allacma fusca]|uniref:DNA-directed RNA polymerase n=1 Tax=Allacma fusca TaxID=39272 RepID=A0A8J2L3J7_9HEXA|nr:unnamed protein product [Allacma fusca]